MKMCVAIIAIFVVLSLHTLTCGGFLFNQMQPSYYRHWNREFLNTADILINSATLKAMEESKNKPNLDDSSIKMLSDLDSCKTGFTAKKVLNAALATDSSNPNREMHHLFLYPMRN